MLVGCFARHIPKRPYGKDCEKYLNGVRDVLLLDNRLVIGAGDGTVELVQERNEIFKDYPSPTVPQFKTVSGSPLLSFSLVVSSKQLNLCSSNELKLSDR